MASPEPLPDYYGDLGLNPGASEAEIKKSFKKLALQFHPDRNPGREAEFHSKFQIINTAHEILTNPESRRKYDASRARAGVGTSRTAGAGTFAKGNPWSNATAGFPPPPQRNSQQRPTPRPPPSTGAQRYANYSKTNPAPPKEPPFDPEKNKRNFEAWSHMRNTGQKVPPYIPTPPRPVPKEYTPQSGREESNNFKHAPPPRSSRPGYQEFRAGAASFGNSAASGPSRPVPPSRKSGFMPNTPGGDEPAAARTSNYFTHRDTRPFSAEEPDPDPIGTAERRAAKNAQKDQDIYSPNNEIPESESTRAADRTNSRRSQAFDDDTSTPLGPRISTPYARQGGEKLDPRDNVPLFRAKSTRERPPQASRSAEERHHSSSPPGSRQRAHRRMSPDAVPRAESDANLNARGGTSPKRTFSTANPLGQKSSTRYHMVESDSSSDSEEVELRPERPMARSRARHPGDNQPSESRFDSSGDRANAATNQSPAYDTLFRPPNLQEPLLQTIPEDPIHIPAGSTPNSPQLEPAKVPAHAPAYKRSESSNSFSIAENHRIPHSSSGVLNAFEKQQFDLLDYLVSLEKVDLPSQNTFKNFRKISGSAKKLGTFDYSRGDHSNPKHRTNCAVAEPLLNLNDQKCSSNECQVGFEQAFSPLETVNVVTSDGPCIFCRRSKTTDTDGTSSSFAFKDDFTRPGPPINRSEENINVNFSKEKWAGKFGAEENYFEPDLNFVPPRTGSRSGRQSPAKRRPVNRAPKAPSAYVEPEPLLAADGDGFSASPGGTKFNAEEWAQTFKPQTFEFPPNSAGQRRFPPSRRSSKPGKGPSVTKTTGTAAIVNEDSSSDDVIYMGSKTAQPTGTDSPNAMDVDTPSETYLNHSRNVLVPPGNPAFRDGVESIRREPPLPPRSPNANISKPRSKEGDDLKVRLEDLKNLEPLQQPATGLGSFKDLNAQLPWASRAANFVPFSYSIASGKIDLPHPPKAPQPPEITANSMRPSTAAWANYIGHFSAYMAAWRAFDEKMVQHFYARRAQSDNKGDGWWAEFGDQKLDQYERGLGEDNTIRAWWDEAARRHGAAMEEFKGWKGTMRDRPDASRLA